MYGSGAATSTSVGSISRAPSRGQNAAPASNCPWQRGHVLVLAEIAVTSI
jgi:hypothetical protein